MGWDGSTVSSVGVGGRSLAGWINKTLAQYNPSVLIDTDLVVPEVRRF